jgi:hypothetical protein
MGVALLALADIAIRRFRGPLRRFDFLLLVTSVFVLLLGSYNLFFVYLMAQGHWYMPVSILFSSLYTIDLAERAAGSFVRRFRPAAMAAMTLLVLAFFLLVYRDPAYNQKFRHFYRKEVPEMLRYYGPAGPPIVEYDDGVIGYFTGYPTLSGFGYAIDREGARAIVGRDLLGLARRRGYERLASYTSLKSQGLTLETPSEEILVKLKEAFPFYEEDLDSYRYAVEYLSPSGRFSVIRYEERP